MMKWEETVYDSNFDYNHELRKKFPNCHKCNKKLIPDQWVMSIVNPATHKIKGILCSDECFQQYQKDMGMIS